MRDIQKATMESNKVIESQKKDKEAFLKNEEAALDRHDLKVATETRQQYVANSDMTRYNEHW